MMSAMTAEQLKELWANTEWNNPFDGMNIHWDGLWDYLYETKRLPEVIEQEYKFVHFTRSAFDADGANEDANDLLDQMDRHWRERLFARWYEAHREEAEQGYNVWWWSNHDINDYVDEEGAL